MRHPSTGREYSIAAGQYVDEMDQEALATATVQNRASAEPTSSAVASAPAVSPSTTPSRASKTKGGEAQADAGHTGGGSSGRPGGQAPPAAGADSAPRPEASKQSDDWCATQRAAAAKPPRPATCLPRGIPAGGG